MKKRQQNIILQLREKKEVKVSYLSNFFRISEVTIRKDLEYLEKQGLLLRIHGGAILIENHKISSEIFYSTRKTKNILEKEKIGRAAANFIEDEEVIFIAAGTTTAQIAKFISERKNLIVITNSINIAQEFGNKSGVHTILIGGILSNELQTLAGTISEEFLQKFYAKKLFLGVGGISIEHGITYFDVAENELRKEMIERSEIRIVMADYTKFNKVAILSVCPINSINKLITDDKVPKDIIEKIREMGVEVIIAE